MANGAIGTSAELTGDLMKMAVRGGEQFAQRVGGNILQRLHPGYIPPEVLAQQRLLKQFEGRLGVVGNLIDPDDEGLKDDDELEARATSTAQALVEVGVADENTAVELRPILPEEATADPITSDRRQKAVMMLRDTLASDYDITSVATPYPITPSKRRDTPVDITATWGAISEELSLLTEQLGDGSHRQPAMLAITGAPYSRAILEERPGQSERVDHYGLLVLQRVGTLPEDNLLVPVA